MSSYQQLATLFTSQPAQLKHTHTHEVGILRKPIEWNPHLHFRFDGHNQEAPAFSPQSHVHVVGIQYYQYLARRQSQVMNSTKINDNGNGKGLTAALTRTLRDDDWGREGCHGVLRTGAGHSRNP